MAARDRDVRGTLADSAATGQFDLFPESLPDADATGRAEALDLYAEYLDELDKIPTLRDGTPRQITDRRRSDRDDAEARVRGAELAERADGRSALVHLYREYIHAVAKPPLAAQPAKKSKAAKRSKPAKRGKSKKNKR